MNTLSVHFRRLVIAHYFGKDVEAVTVADDQKLARLIIGAQDPYKKTRLNEDQYFDALESAAIGMREAVERIKSFRKDQIEQINDTSN
jgi:hypothetical protein